MYVFEILEKQVKAPCRAQVETKNWKYPLNECQGILATLTKL